MKQNPTRTYDFETCHTVALSDIMHAIRIYLQFLSCVKDREDLFYSKSIEAI